MSAEHAEGKKEIDHRADIFSFGVVLYRLCTGELSFQGDTVFPIIDSLLQHQPLPIDRVNPTIPQRFSDLIGRMIAKDPKIDLQLIRS